MFFFRLIDKLRNRPKQERLIISLASALTIFSMIFFVWLTTFQLNSEKIKNEERYDKLSPISSLKNMTVRLTQEIKNKINTLSFSNKKEFGFLGSVLQPEMPAEINTATTYKNATEEILDENGDSAETMAEEGFFLENKENRPLAGTSSNEFKVKLNSVEIASSSNFESIQDIVPEDEKTNNQIN